jgi:hypothetical protein
MRVSDIIYAYFQTLNIPVEGCAGNPDKSWRRQIAKQTLCGYCYLVVRSDGVAKALVPFREEDAVGHFLEAMQKEQDYISSHVPQRHGYAL